MQIMSKELKVQATTFKGHKGVDIRYYVESPEYTGPTPRGVWIPKEKWAEELKKMNELVVP